MMYMDSNVTCHCGIIKWASIAPAFPKMTVVGTYQTLAKVHDIENHIYNEPQKSVTVLKYLGKNID